MNTKSSSATRVWRMRERLTQLVAAGITVVLGLSLTSMMWTLKVSAVQSNCSAPAAGAPMRVNADCMDPRFNRAVIDIDQWRDQPVRHRYVNGHFDGTDARFSFYFPLPEQYRGRFFQNTHQL